jgi:hypothetical protein
MHIHRLALLTLLVAACGSSAKSPAPQKPVATTDDPSCPVSVPGTSVTAEDTPTGAALVFVTTGDAAELRKRAGTMASMHNEHHAAMGPLPDGKDAGGGHEGHDMSGHAGHDMSGAKGGKHAGHAGGMIGVHSKAATEDVQGGAKIVFTAGGADVAKLQTELRMHAQHLAGGSCKMAHH